MTNIAGHCWKGLGLSEESQTVNSTAVQPEEIGQEEDANMLDEAERKKVRNLAVTLNHMNLDRSDVQDAAKGTCTKMATPTLEETEEGSQISERSRHGDEG